MKFVKFNDFVLNEAQIDKDLEHLVDALNDLNLKGTFERWGLDINYIVGKDETVVLKMENSRHRNCICFPEEKNGDDYGYQFPFKKFDIIVKFIKEKIQ